MTDHIKVYGAPWCPDCKRSKKFLAVWITGASRHANPPRGTPDQFEAAAEKVVPSYQVERA
jgi:glutaredoxin